MKSALLILFCLMALSVAAVPLFDIYTEIPESYQTVQAGKDVLASIRLVNVGSAGRIDVYLDYVIKDEQGKTLLTKLETVAVETQATFVRSFYIPPHTKPGRYTLETKLVYFDGHQAASAATFIIVESPMAISPKADGNLYQDIFYILASLLLLDLLALVTIKYIWPLAVQKPSSLPQSFYTSLKSKLKKR